MPLDVQIRQASNMDLCRATFYAPAGVSQMARQEAQSRSVDCREYMAAIVQQEQARQAAGASLLMQQQAQPLIPPLTYTPVPPQAQQRTVCTTSRIGNELQTVCR